MVTIQVTDADKISIEKELAIVLFNMSAGDLSSFQAKKLASVAVKNIDFSNSALAHKGVNWYARRLLKIIDIKKFANEISY